jgi:hypothetical protein
MNGSEILTRPPAVSFGLEKVAPPFPSYVSAADRLVIEARSSVSNLEFQAHLRLLKPDGEIVPGLNTYKPSADRSLNTWGQDLAEGFIVGLVVDAPANAKPGACYVRVLLVRGAAPTPPIAQVLVAGYVVTGSGLIWPQPRYVHPAEGPGRLRIITGTDPAAGNQILETVPTGARWKLLALRAALLTSAAVANRSVQLWFDDGATTWYELPPMVDQPASTYYTYNWAIGVSTRAGVPTGWVQDPLPDRITLAAGWRFQTVVANMQAGDDWYAPVYYVEEWVEP